MKKWLFPVFITMLSINSLAFSMEESNIEIESYNTNIVRLNSQSSRHDNLGKLPKEISRQIVILSTNDRKWPERHRTMRLVCKEFNFIVSFQKANDLQKLINGEILYNIWGREYFVKFKKLKHRRLLIDIETSKKKDSKKSIVQTFISTIIPKDVQFPWISSFKFKKPDDCHRLQTDEVPSTLDPAINNSIDPTDFSLAAINEAIAQNNIQFKGIVTMSNFEMRDYKVMIDITTFKGTVPAYERAFPPQSIWTPCYMNCEANNLCSDLKLASNFTYLGCIVLSRVIT